MKIAHKRLILALWFYKNAGLSLIKRDDIIGVFNVPLWTFSSGTSRSESNNPLLKIKYPYQSEANAGEGNKDDAGSPQCGKTSVVIGHRDSHFNSRATTPQHAIFRRDWSRWTFLEGGAGGCTATHRPLCPGRLCSSRNVPASPCRKRRSTERQQQIKTSLQDTNVIRPFRGCTAKNWDH